MAMAYYEFSKKAQEVESNSNIYALFSTKNINDSEAIETMHEYQLACASAFLIPSFVWRQMRDKLNVMWKNYCKQ